MIQNPYHLQNFLWALWPSDLILVVQILTFLNIKSQNEFFVCVAMSIRRKASYEEIKWTDGSWIYVYTEKSNTRRSSNPYFFSIQTISMSVLVFSFSSWIFKWSLALNLHFRVLHRLGLKLTPAGFFVLFWVCSFPPVFPMCPTCTKRSSKGTVSVCVPWDEFYEDETDRFIWASLGRDLPVWRAGKSGSSLPEGTIRTFPNELLHVSNYDPRARLPNPCDHTALLSLPGCRPVSQTTWKSNSCWEPTTSLDLIIPRFYQRKWMEADEVRWLG